MASQSVPIDACECGTAADDVALTRYDFEGSLQSPQTRFPGTDPTDRKLTRLDWPDDDAWQWPFFTIDIEQYNIDEEPGIRAVNTITPVITTVRDLTNCLDRLVAAGRRDMANLMQGRRKENPTDWESVEIRYRTHTEWYDDQSMVERLDAITAAYRDLSIAARPSLREPIDDIGAWVAHIQFSAEHLLETYDRAVGYDPDPNRLLAGDEKRLSDISLGPAVLETDLDKFTHAHRQYREALYDIALDGVVSTIYDNVTPVGETNEYGI